MQWSAILCLVKDQKRARHDVILVSLDYHQTDGVLDRLDFNVLLNNGKSINFGPRNWTNARGPLLCFGGPN